MLQNIKHQKTYFENPHKYKLRANFGKKSAVECANGKKSAVERANFHSKSNFLTFVYKKG